MSQNRKKSYQITNIIRYVISIAICGMTQQQAQIFLLYNDITPPTKAQFYACQQMLIPIFEKLARDVCKRFADEKDDRFYIRYDGSWSCRRNASHCLVEFINEDGKIIDFEYMSRIKCTTLRVEAGYFGPSNRMETLLVEQLTERWKHNQKVKGFVHDGDLKTPKFWQSDDLDHEVPIIELHDPNHAKNRLSNIFDRANKSKKLYGLKKQVISYFKYLVKTPKYTNDEKIAKWSNLEDKLRENAPSKSYLNQSSRRHKEQFEECQNALKDFIQNSLELFQSCLITDTQSNESFHAFKSKLAPKSIAWGTSWKLRICLAVLQWNLGEDLRAFLDEKFDLNISTKNSALLQKIELSLKRRRYVSKSTEERFKRNVHRKIKREGNKDDPNGHKYKNDQKKKGRKENQSKEKGPIQQKEMLMQSRICAGVTNAGSTCFFASVIQILANTEVPSILKAQRMTQIPNSFFNVLNTVFQQLLSDKDVTKDMVEHVFEFFGQYKTNVQSDANEFFHFLINSLGMYFQCLFSFYHTEAYMCQRCSFQSNNWALINQLELHPISHIMTITDLLNDYFSKQYDVECICSRCQTTTVHIKRNIFRDLPKYLVLKINYISPEHMKICRIKALNEIKITLPNGLAQNYKLNGILYYSGNGNCGHFWSITCKRGQLRIHNDSRSGYLKTKNPREYGIDTIFYQKCFPTF